jgi:hypothetical protein
VHLENDARQGNLQSQAILAAIPKCPPLVAYLWNYFQQISATERPPSGMDGPKRIPRSGIHAWEADEGIKLERWERRCIIAMDAEWQHQQFLAMAEASNSNKTEAHLRGPQERHG